MAETLRPDVVVMDLNMPGMSGVEATRRVGSGAGPNRTEVLVLSAHADRRLVDDVLAAGASGYVLKDAAFEELVAAVREVSAGRVFVSPSLASGCSGP